MLTRTTPAFAAMKLSIIIPAFNEADTIEAVIRRIMAVDLGETCK